MKRLLIIGLLLTLSACNNDMTETAGAPTRAYEITCWEFGNVRVHETVDTVYLRENGLAAYRDGNPLYISNLGCLVKKKGA